MPEEYNAGTGFAWSRPMRRRLLFGLWGLAGLCSTAGCSFLFVHGPPPDHERLPFFDCSSSNVLPVLDALYAGWRRPRLWRPERAAATFSTTSSSTTGRLGAGRRGCPRRRVRCLRVQQDVGVPEGAGGDAQTGGHAARAGGPTFGPSPTPTSRRPGRLPSTRGRDGPSGRCAAIRRLRRAGSAPGRAGASSVTCVMLSRRAIEGLTFVSDIGHWTPQSCTTRAANGTFARGPGFDEKWSFDCTREHDGRIAVPTQEETPP